MSPPSFDPGANDPSVLRHDGYIQAGYLYNYKWKCLVLGGTCHRRRERFRGRDPELGNWEANRSPPSFDRDAGDPSVLRHDGDGCARRIQGGDLYRYRHPDRLNERRYRLNERRYR